MLAEGREELNFEKAKDAYRHVQQTITRGESLELYADVVRMLPDHIKPECVEKLMEIQEDVREEPQSRSTAHKKRQRNDDLGRSIPAGASDNPVSVKDLMVSGPKKRRKSNQSRDFSDAGAYGKDHLEIEGGLDVAASSLRHTGLKKAQSSERLLGQARTTMSRNERAGDEGKEGGSKGKSKGKGKKAVEEEKEWAASQYERTGPSPSDDAEVEAEAVPMVGFTTAAALHRRRRNATTCASRSCSPEVPITNTPRTLDPSPRECASLQSNPCLDVYASCIVEEEEEFGLSVSLTQTADAGSECHRVLARTRHLLAPATSSAC